MERRCRGNLLYQVKVAIQSVALLRKISCQRLDEAFPAIGQAEALTLKRDNIVASGIETRQLHIVEHAKIAQEAIEHLPLIGTTDEVHARFELHIMAREALQTATHLSALFQDGHLIAIATQNQTASQPTQATTYHDAFLSHVLCRCKFDGMTATLAAIS